MKCLVTYFQNKRVSLPYIFTKYTLPMMQKIFPGEVKLYHIHHDCHIVDHRLESNRDLAYDSLIRTREYMAKFENVISHDENFPDFLLLPSCKISLQLCQTEDADLHLWLEDDAIVHDTMCHLWPILMKNIEIGTFRETAHKKMFNCAFMISTKEYDKRLLGALNDYKDNGTSYPESSQFENLLWQVSKSSCLLHRNAAIRHHPRGLYACNRQQIETWLRDTIPSISNEDIELLKLDYE